MLVCTSELSLARGHPIASKVRYVHRLVVDVALLVAYVVHRHFLFGFRNWFGLSVVEVLLGSHALVISSGARGNWPLSVCRLRTSGLIFKVEIVEVVEH